MTAYKAVGSWEDLQNREQIALRPKWGDLFLLRTQIRVPISFRLFCLILLSDMVWSPWLLMNLNNSTPTKLKGMLENVRKRFCVLGESSRYLYADLDDSCTVMLRLAWAKSTKVPFLFCPSHFWFLSMSLQFRKTFAWFSRDIFKNKKRQHYLLKTHGAISSERRVIVSIRIPTPKKYPHKIFQVGYVVRVQ